jgi:hypothetical protein
MSDNQVRSEKRPGWAPPFTTDPRDEFFKSPPR